MKTKKEVIESAVENETDAIEVSVIESGETGEAAVAEGKLKFIRPAIVCLLILTLICGVIYPLAVTGVAQVVFPYEANGSIITVTLPDGRKVDYGSEFIGQNFTSAKYLIGRVNPGAGTNLSPASEELKKLVQERVDFLKSIDPTNTADIPHDLVTVSGSGLDPHITVAGAKYQIARLARERNMPEQDVKKIIKKYTEGRFLWILGEPRVNVLLVNLALDGLL